MIITIDEEATIGEAVELMHENGIGALLVTREEEGGVAAAGNLGVLHGPVLCWGGAPVSIFGAG